LLKMLRAALGTQRAVSKPHAGMPGILGVSSPELDVPKGPVIDRP